MSQSQIIIKKKKEKGVCLQIQPKVSKSLNNSIWETGDENWILRKRELSKDEALITERKDQDTHYALNTFFSLDIFQPENCSTVAVPKQPH